MLLVCFFIFALVCTFAVDVDAAIQSVTVDDAAQAVVSLADDAAHDAALLFYAPIDEMTRTVRYRSRLLMRARALASHVSATVDAMRETHAVAAFKARKALTVRARYLASVGVRARTSWMTTERASGLAVLALIPVLTIALTSCAL